MVSTVFDGTIPALMTPCAPDRSPDFDAMVSKAEQLIATGMSAVVYCGSMGDWPLLTDEQRQTGVSRLVDAGIPVVVGTGAVNSAAAQDHAAHAQKVGAQGLMVIPRVLSRGTSQAAQKAHFSAILEAAPDLPAIIYNSPYYGFTTKADLFFELREKFRNLIGFKEFGGVDDLRYAAEFITNQDDSVSLVIGVDTNVYHGFVNCNASGVITGIGNVLPEEVLVLVKLSRLAATGNLSARAYAQELDAALHVLSSFDEGPDLVLYFKHMLTVLGEPGYVHHFNPTDSLSDSQRKYAERQLSLFQTWYAEWVRQQGVQALLV